jgi:site-specific recombinase XerD
MPADRVTRANVEAYVGHLQTKVMPRTMVSSLVGTKVMIMAMAQDQDWRWLKDVCNRLNRNAKPGKDKRSRILDSGLMFRTALKHLDQLSKTDLTTRKQLVGFCNGLMIALMTACPLRLNNFAALAMGTTLRRSEEGWLLKIPGSQTKNKQPLELVVPAELNPHIHTYLERLRIKIATPAESALWVSWGGGAMTPHSIYIAFTRFTTTLFGKPINPHLFRDCAATTLATKSLKAAIAAPGLLGHKGTKTARRARPGRPRTAPPCMSLRPSSAGVAAGWRPITPARQTAGGRRSGPCR